MDWEACKPTGVQPVIRPSFWLKEWRAYLVLLGDFYCVMLGSFVSFGDGCWVGPELARFHMNASRRLLACVPRTDV